MYTCLYIHVNMYTFLLNCIHLLPVFNWNGYYPTPLFPCRVMVFQWTSCLKCCWRWGINMERSCWKSGISPSGAFCLLFLSQFSLFSSSLSLIWVRIMMMWLSAYDPWEIHTEGITLIVLCPNQLKSYCVYCTSFVLFFNSILGNHTFIFLWYFNVLYQTTI